jgi:hypothetical protein
MAVELMLTTPLNDVSTNALLSLGHIPIMILDNVYLDVQLTPLDKTIHVNAFRTAHIGELLLII